MTRLFFFVVVSACAQDLQFYIKNWQDPQTRSARIALILETIQIQPDLQPHPDSRALLVNPDDSSDYAVIRHAWFQQVEQNPDNPKILLNAARGVQLTDRESAEQWLKHAIAIDPAGDYRDALGSLYGYAITGITGMNPWEGPTAYNASDSRSAFAQHARQEASRDAIVAARTGWAINLSNEALHRAKLTTDDYDNIAEELLLTAAKVDYPNPSSLPFLGVFYRRHAGRFDPKFRIVEMPADRLTELRPEKIGFTDKNFHEPVTVSLRVTFGIDGHVWKTEAIEAPSKPLGEVAASAVEFMTVKPLRIGQEPVEMTATISVLIEPGPLR
jgi:hypothetical protein